MCVCVPSSERVVSSNNGQIKNDLRPRGTVRNRTAIRPKRFWIVGDRCNVSSMFFYECSTRKQFFYDKRYLNANVYELYRQFTKIPLVRLNQLRWWIKTTRFIIHVFGLDSIRANGIGLFVMDFPYMPVRYFVRLFGCLSLFRSCRPPRDRYSSD